MTSSGTPRALPAVARRFATIGAVVTAALCWIAGDAAAQTYPLDKPALSLDLGGGILSSDFTPDGGILIGGYFRGVSGVSRSGLAKLKGDGALDPSFNATVDGTVSVVRMAGPNAVVSGSFTQVNGAAKPYLAKITAAGALLASFSPAPSAEPRAIAGDANGNIYVAGNITVGGLSGRSIVKLDATTGSGIAAWNPVLPKPLDMSYLTMAVNGSWLYVSASTAPDTSCLSGLLFRISLTTGDVDTSWAPPPANTNRGGLHLAFDTAGNVFASGDVDTFTAGSCTSPSPGLGKFSAATGALMSSTFSASAAANSRGVAADATGLYAVVGIPSPLDGDGGNPSGPWHEAKVVRLDLDSGALVWSSKTETGIQGVAVGPNAVIASGSAMRDLGGPPTFGMAAIDKTSGAQVGTFVARVVVQGGGMALLQAPDSKVYVGGLFDFVNGVPRSNLARLHADGSLDTTWTTGANGEIWSLQLVGDFLYAGGFFSKSGATTRYSAARFFASSGSLDPDWNPSVTGGVRHIVASDSAVYLMGAFTGVGGASRRALAKVDATTGALSSAFSPPVATDTCGFFVFQSVNSGFLANGHLYVGAQRGTLGTGACVPGSFSESLAGRRMLLRLDPNTGAPDPGWDPNPNHTVRSFVVSGNDVYVGGDFGTFAGVSRTRLAKFNLATGALDSGWSGAPADFSIITMAKSSSHLYVGGLSSVMSRHSLADGSRDTSWTAPAVTFTNVGYRNGRNAIASADGASVIFALGNSYVVSPAGERREGIASFATGAVAQRTGPFAYVANSGSNSVSVIDTARNAVTATIPVGSGSTHTAVNRSASRAFVNDFNANMVHVIDTATNAVVSSIAVGGGPQVAVVNSAGTRMYVTNRNTNNVSVIDLASGTVMATLAVGPGPLAIALGRTRGFVTNNDGNTVSYMDIANNLSLPGTITVGNNPTGIVLNSAGTRLYVANSGSGTVSVADPVAGTVIGTITVGNTPRGLRFNANGSRLYVANAGDGTVGIIDVATNTVIGNIPVGASPRTIALSPDGASLYVANYGSNSVSVISTATNTVVNTIAVGSAPIGISIAPAAPGAPTIDSVTVGSGTATVSFSAPALNGFSSITSYTVTCSAPGAGAPITATGTSSPITITGLSNGVTYSCTVAATNAVGTGSASTAVAVVPAASSTTKATIASNQYHTLALDADGQVYAWGRNFAGQLGNGTTTSASVPAPVFLPAVIRSIAAGFDYSVAVDTSGKVWLWGANQALPTMTTSATPQIVEGLSNVRSVAAGFASILYLMEDGTVRISGWMAGTLNPEVTNVPGLAGIVAVGATMYAAYALRSDGAVLAWGDNVSGALGLGDANVRNATPAPVPGISGNVVQLRVGVGGPVAVTGDGKVWTWGGEQFGNVPVQAPGIGDAVDATRGPFSVFAIRQNGGMYAWGRTGLAQVGTVATPVTFGFHEPVQSLVADIERVFIVGRSGVVWGFGAATIGDGAYVRRASPVVVLAADGKGSLDTDDWYLDLDRSVAQVIPTGAVPTSLGIAQSSGTDAALNLDAKVKYKAGDFGKAVNNYVFGLVPARFFGFVKAAPGTPPMEMLQKMAKENEGYLLAQLTPQGWMVVQSQLTSYSQGTANAAGGALNLLRNIPASQFAGSRFCIGYGEGSGSMLSFQSLSEVLQLEGATPKTTNVPCVLTGVYVDGPAKSRSGSAVTFNASVVGLMPSGSVQFTDGGSSLQSAMAITRQNDAVAKVALTTSSLTVGMHTIGATYLGDTQNAAAAAAIPVRHEVESIPPGESKTVIEGATSSNAGTTAVFTATVTGNNASGSVQFKDNGVPLGDAVPLPREGDGRVVLRVAELAPGAHGISATYSGDGANQGSSSAVMAHEVLPGVTTSVTVAASPEALSTGSPVTLTTTVAGSSPTGTVTFRDGTLVLGTVSLVNGSASLTVASLDAGSYAITADYAGDAQNPAVSSSRAVFVSVSVPGLVTLLPTAVDFGAHSMRTTTPPRPVDALNTSGGTITVSSITVTGEFSVSHGCSEVANGSSCRALVRFTPPAEGAYSGVLTIQTSKGPFTVPLTGTGEKSLTSHYYRSILGRDPDAGGKAYWESEAARIQALGVNVNEAWYALAMAFYLSPEYAAFNRNQTDHVRDLYNTFFNRAADAAGLSYWTGLIDAGLPREIVLSSFMFSGEFVNFTRAIYGNTAARAEVDTVVDFYRGLLGRLPDSGGFNHWLGQFRTAQCQGAQAVYAQVEAISSAYANSPEYGARNRTNAQYVGDMYNTFLRRGGDLGGVQFWIGQLDAGAGSREDVRRAFIASPEFSARVAAIVAEGCMQ